MSPNFKIHELETHGDRPKTVHPMSHKQNNNPWKHSKLQTNDAPLAEEIPSMKISASAPNVNANRVNINASKVQVPSRVILPTNNVKMSPSKEGGRTPKPLPKPMPKKHKNIYLQIQKAGRGPPDMNYSYSHSPMGNNKRHNKDIHNHQMIINYIIKDIKEHHNQM